MIIRRISRENGLCKLSLPDWLSVWMVAIGQSPGWVFGIEPRSDQVGFILVI